MSSSFTFNPTMSLYIPRVYKNITPRFIMNVFEDKIKFGKILSVHMKKNPHCKNNYSAIIHFESWNETIVTTNFQTKIHRQNFARVVHDDPWFWIVLENNQQIIHPEKEDNLKDSSYIIQDPYAIQDQEKDKYNNRIQHKYQDINLFEIINGIVYHHKINII